MEEQEFSQLRFDISETVRLHPQQLGIGSLLNLDLYPEVEISDKGKHLKIQGYLRLRGDYLVDDMEAGERESETLGLGENNQEEISYIIPVEITLPSDRAHLDQLSAEIESFDYTVLSPFELQVEAILTIDGLLPENATYEKSVDATPTPTFSGSEGRATAEAWVNTSQEDTSQEDTSQEDTIEMHFDTGEVLIEPAEQPTESNTKPVEQEKQLIQQEQILPQEKSIPLETEEYPEHQEIVENQVQEDTYFHEETIHHPQELKIDTPAETEHGVDEDEDEESSPDEVPTVDTELGDHSNDDILGENEKWSSWLLNNREENFTPMRLVIVQEEQSIMSFAEKYGISYNQITQMNKLENDRIVEGMIVNVPIATEELVKIEHNTTKVV